MPRVYMERMLELYVVVDTSHAPDPEHAWCVLDNSDVRNQRRPLQKILEMCVPSDRVHQLTGVIVGTWEAHFLYKPHEIFRGTPVKNESYELFCDRIGSIKGHILTATDMISPQGQEPQETHQYGIESLRALLDFLEKHRATRGIDLLHEDVIEV